MLESILAGDGRQRRNLKPLAAVYRLPFAVNTMLKVPNTLRDTSILEKDRVTFTDSLCNFNIEDLKIPKLSSAPKPKIFFKYIFAPVRNALSHFKLNLNFVIGYKSYEI